MAGKTTLIKVITQLIQETDGSVSLFSSTNRSQWTQALKRVGSVIESPVAHKHMTAYQNLIYYCKARHIPNPDQVIKETLNYVGLNNTGKKKFAIFHSGWNNGWELRLLSLQSRLPHFDEPINGLDPVESRNSSDDQAPQRWTRYDHLISVISFPSFIWWPIVGIVDQGRLIKEISKAEFEEQGEDYIILKTSQLALRVNWFRISSITASRSSIMMEIIFGQTHDIKVIVKALVQADIDVDESLCPPRSEKILTDLVD